MYRQMFNPFYSRRLKYVGMLMVLWGFIAFFLKYQTYAFYDFNLLCGLISWGLCFIFFSKEKLDDERIHMLKFEALAYGVPIGLMVTHLINYFFLNTAEPDAGHAVESISAFQSLTIILAISLAVFYSQKLRGERE